MHIFWKSPITPKHWLTILALLATLRLFAQNALPFRSGDTWGMIDTTGTVIIPPSLGFIDDFNPQGWAVAKKDGQSGVIDQTGKMVIPARYEKILLFENGYAAAWENGQCGLLELSSGKWAVSPQYEAIVPLVGTLFRTFSHAKYGVMKADGAEVLPPQLDVVAGFTGGSPVAGLLKGEKKGLLGRSGAVLLQPKYDGIELSGNTAIGKERIALTEVIFDENGQEVGRNEYPNDMALKVARENARKKAMVELLRENPEARKPRWVEHNFRIYLEDGAGHNLLGKLEFFDVGIDEELGLSLAREVIFPEKEGDSETIKTYLVDHENAKVLFKSDCEDMVISDFRESTYARATVDTLWDALIDKQGNLVREIEGNRIANIGNFASGRAWLQSGNRFGFIDTKGQMAIPLQYELVSDFNGPYAIAKKDGMFGAINTAGKAVLPFQFDGIQVPVDGACVVKKGKGRNGRWGIINMQQKTLLPFEYSMVYPFKDGKARIRQGNKWGLVNTKGKILFPATVECDYLEEFENGIAIVGMGRQVIETTMQPLVTYTTKGVIRENGEFILPPEYESIGGFQGIWNAQKGVAELVKKGKKGYVNYLGEMVLPAEYDEVRGFEKIWKNNKGLAMVKQGELYGYIDHNGEPVLPVSFTSIDTTFEQVWADSAGLAKASQNRNFGYIDYTGSPVIPFRYDFISGWLNGQLAVVRHGEKWGAINSKNEQVLPLIYDEIRAVEGSEEQLLQILSATPVFYLINGKGQIEQKLSEEAANALKGVDQEAATTAIPGALDETGLRIADKKGRLALAAPDGSPITKYNFVEIHPFQDGLARVKYYDKDRTNQLYGYIDKAGNEVIPPQFKLAQDFSDGKAAVVDRIRWGYIDKTGKMVIEPSFKDAGPFLGGFAFVEENQIIDAQGKTVGSFDLEGEVTGGFAAGRAVVSSLKGQYHITPAGTPAYFTQFDEVTPFVGEVAFVKKGEKWELTREVDGVETKLYFNKTNKLQYIAEYGERRSEKLKYGQVIKDVSWKLVDDGRWRMIDRQGNYLGEVVYDEVKRTADGHFVAKVSRRFGIADLQGNILAKQVHETVKHVGNGIIRLESEGKTGYLRKNGEWIRQVQ